MANSKGGAFGGIWGNAPTKGGNFLKGFEETENLYRRLPEVLLDWYYENARDLPWRKNKDPYRVWVSEIMLQQTVVKTVCGYYERFLTAFPTVQDLAAASDDKLMKLWEGLGYYSRAKNLKKAALQIVNDYQGQFPQKYEEILSLSGIGTYTAGAITSICFEQPKAAVDGNVLRVLSRITTEKAPVNDEKTKKHMALCLEKVYPKGQCGNFTQALIELGALICTPKTPKCTQCPAKDFCLACKNNVTDRYPVKKPPMEKKLEYKTVFLLHCGKWIALERRTEKGLLSNLWQLPNTNGLLQPNDAIQYIGNYGIFPKELVSERHDKHIFTHKRWEMVCYEIQCTNKSSQFIWVNEEQLQKDYALPTAFRKFIDIM